MSLNDLFTSVVTSDGAGLKQVGFGTIMLVSYHTRFPERQRLYADLSDMVSDNFETGDAAYKMAEAAFAQDPRPANVRVGRLALPYTQTIKWTPTITTEGYVQTLTIELGDDKLTAESTNGAGATVATIIDAMLTAVEALDAFDSTLTVTDGTTYMQIVTDEGLIAFYSDWTGKFEDVTTDPGIATDLGEIQLENDDWYGLAVDLNSRLIQEEASDWAEPAKKLIVHVTSDWQAKDVSETVDIGDVLQAKSYAYSASYFDNARDTGEYMNVRAMGERFPHDPGLPPGAGGTWHGKTLAGASLLELAPAEKTILKDKGYNVYVSTAGRNHTLYGVTASGEYIDVTRFLDWNDTRIREALAFAILSAEKVPYTDGGVAILQTQVSKVLDIGVQAGGWSPDPYPVCTAVKVANVLPADKAARQYNGLKWSAILAGAIHGGVVSGTVSI